MGPPFVFFTVDESPQGKGRHRLGYNSHTGRPQMFTPGATLAYEKLVAWLAFSAMKGRAPTERPVRLALDVHMRPPVLSRPKLAALLALPPSRKPDLDNVLKAIGDACNAVVWKDDVQVADAILRRHWSDRPRVEVWVWELSAPLWSAFDLAQLADGMSTAPAGPAARRLDDPGLSGGVDPTPPEKRLKTRLNASAPVQPCEATP